MDWSEILIMVLQGVIVPLMVWGIVTLRNYLMRKIKLKEAESVLVMATDAAILAVQTTSQKLVDDLKEQGKFDAKAQRTAFLEALELSKSILGKQTMEILEYVTSNANGYLTVAIETAVREGKDNGNH